MWIAYLNKKQEGKYGMLKSGETYTGIIKILRSAYIKNYFSEKLAIAVTYFSMEEGKVKMGPGSDIRLVNSSI